MFLESLPNLKQPGAALINIWALTSWPLEYLKHLFQSGFLGMSKKPKEYGNSPLPCRSPDTGSKDFHTLQDSFSAHMPSPSNVSRLKVFL